MAVDALFAVATRRSVERKSTLVVAGQPARTLYLVVAGRIRLLRQEPTVRT